jgi:hypothetical protein
MMYQCLVLSSVTGIIVYDPILRIRSIT